MLQPAIAQLPAVHVGEPFVTEHALPHEPQFATLVCVLVHEEPQRTSVGEHPDEHAKTPLVFIEQVGVEPEHATPHAPQSVPLPRKASQPFDGL